MAEVGRDVVPSSEDTRTLQDTVQHGVDECREDEASVVLVDAWLYWLTWG